MENQNEVNVVPFKHSKIVSSLAVVQLLLVIPVFIYYVLEFFSWYFSFDSLIFGFILLTILIVNFHLLLSKDEKRYKTFRIYSIISFIFIIATLIVVILGLIFQPFSNIH
ncbi:MAG: hypothetical protein WCO07_03255 [bacterium]